MSWERDGDNSGHYYITEWEINILYVRELLQWLDKGRDLRMVGRKVCKIMVTTSSCLVGVG